MTSEFDTLAGIGYLAENSEKYKEIALQCADLAREELEERLKIKYEDWDKKDLYDEEGDFAIFEWFGEIHSIYDHTEKWHGLLIPWNLQRLNDAIYALLQEERKSERGEERK